MVSIKNLKIDNFTLYTIFRKQNPQTLDIFLPNPYLFDRDTFSFLDLGYEPIEYSWMFCIRFHSPILRTCQKPL